MTKLTCEKMRFAHLQQLINIYAKYQVNQVKTVEVECPRFQTIEFSPRKSTPNRIFTKSKGHNSAMTKLTWKNIRLAHQQLLNNINFKYQVNQIKTEEVQQIEDF